MSTQDSLSSSGEEGVVEWVNQYGWYVLYGVIALMMVAIGGYRLSSSSNQKAESDYLLAEKKFQIFQKNGDKTALHELSAILNRYPDLHAKYDGLMAQQLLNRGEIKEAEVFADLATLRTIDDHLPFYTDYAVISLMISKADFHEALDKTQRLKKGMLKNLELAKVRTEPKKFGDILFAFNLLREALLLEQMGDRKGEIAAWKEFKEYAGLTTGTEKEIPPHAFRQLLHQFESGKENLVTFIQQREKQIDK